MFKPNKGHQQPLLISNVNDLPDKLTTSVLIPCDDCNEPVAASHLVTTRRRQLCQPCAERKIAVSIEES